MGKPRILLYVLCGRERDTWVNPALCRQLLQLQDARFDVTVDFAYDLKPHERARNHCVMNAKHGSYTHLCMIDNDMILPAKFANVLHETVSSGKAVVGLKYGALAWEGEGLRMLACHDNGPVDGNFRRTGQVGGGVLIISADVWRKVPGPWFRWLVNDDEWTSQRISEDLYFCELVQAQGFEVWTHKQAAGHLKTMDLTAMCKTLGMDR